MQFLAFVAILVNWGAQWLKETKVAWRALVTLFNKDRPPGPQDRILPKERQRKPHKL